jgi:hypothetical protein
MPPPALSVSRAHDKVDGRSEPTEAATREHRQRFL